MKEKPYPTKEGKAGVSHHLENGDVFKNAPAVKGNFFN